MKLQLCLAAILTSSCGEHPLFQSEKSSRQTKINSMSEQFTSNMSRELRSAQGDEKKAEIHRKYSLMRIVFNKEVEKFKKSEVHRDQQELNNAIHIQKDASYPEPHFSSVYHPRELKEVSRVFNRFGDLYVNETVDCHGNIQPRSVEVPKNKRPWSGFWYPFGSKDLYSGPDSPLAKFDELVSKTGSKSLSASREEKRNRVFNPDSWEGLCDAWSMASVSVPEPNKNKVLHGINFTIADQKALLTFAHLKRDKEVFGIAYRGNADTDGTYQDIRPEAFHRIILTAIGEEGKAVIIDDVAGVQVWNKPLYRMRWKIEKDPEFDFAFLVKAWPQLIKERTKETDKPTSSFDILAPNYQYRLYVDKNIQKNGGYKVIAGQWLGKSFRNHPDTVTYPLGGERLGSHNPEFNKHIKLFKSLFLD